MKEKDKKKQTVTLPNRIIYPLGARLFALYLKITRKLRVDNSATKDLCGPYVVISNHESLYDFGAVARACLPNRISFIVSSHFFHKPFLRWLFETCGCISKRQFYPDFASIRKMLRVIKQGGCIGIFPEGQTCWSGACCDVDPSIGKLVKTLGVPVINVKVRGNYLTSPKWAKGKEFRTHTEAVSELLLTQEQVRSMEPEEIADAVIRGLSYNEYDWQREKMYADPKRSLDGLDYYFWKCPQCGAEFTLSARDNVMTCSECGLTLRMDEYGFLHSDSAAVAEDPPRWFAWQQEELRRALEAGELLPIRFHARFMESAWGETEEAGYRCSGEGDVLFDETGMHFDGVRDGAPFTYYVNPKVQWNLTHGVELYSIDIAADVAEDRDYAFDLDNPRLLMKIIQAWPLVRERMENSN